jgi:hypothetical protein
MHCTDMDAPKPWTRGAPCPCCGPSRALSPHWHGPSLKRLGPQAAGRSKVGTLTRRALCGTVAAAQVAHAGAFFRVACSCLPPSESPEAPPGGVSHCQRHCSRWGHRVGRGGPPRPGAGSSGVSARVPGWPEVAGQNADSQKRGHSAGSVGAPAVRGRTPSPRAAGRAPCEGPDGCPAPRLSRTWPCATQLGPSD